MELVQGARDTRGVPLSTSKGAKALEVGAKFRGQVTGTALLRQKKRLGQRSEVALENKGEGQTMWRLKISTYLTSPTRIEDGDDGSWRFSHFL